MRKLEEEGKHEDSPPVLQQETPILDIKPKLLPKIEPSETKPLHVESTLNPETPPFEPSIGPAVSQVIQAGESPSHLKPESSSRTDELTAVVKLVAEQQRMSLLPAQQPPIFSGNHFEYAAFISAFESLIECRVSDPKQRLYYLSQYTSGDAKESIQGLITLDSPDSYDKAKKGIKGKIRSSLSRCTGLQG